MFYLNYEECKDVKKLLKLYKTGSFILTMRNVKSLLETLSANVSPRFILTMRNVKSNPLYKRKEQSEVLS